MADIRITPASSIMAFTSSLSFKETLTQDASGSIVLYGSGSTGRTNVFAIDGGSGRLFSVDDSLSDSLFSVNTIAGLPVIEAFADNTVNIGKYGAYSFVATGSGDARIGSGSVMFVSASGNVGIGTTNPLAKLHIAATSGVASPGSIALAIRDLGSPTFGFNFNLEGVSTGDLSLMRVVSGVQSQVMTFDRANGNVGIGTTSPGYKLEVNGITNVGALLSTGTTTTSIPIDTGGAKAYLNATSISGPALTLVADSVGRTLRLASNTSGTVIGVIDANSAGLLIGTNTNYPITFNPNATERMRITTAGNVGIGTTNPSAKLEVSGGDNTLIVTGAAPSSAYAAFIISQTNSGFGIYDQAAKHYFAGSVGIGTTSPSYKLHVEDTNPRILVKATSTGYAINYLQNDGGTLQTFLDNSAGGGFGFGNYVRGLYSTGAYDFILTSNATERMRITSAGLVGIGTTAPASILQLGAGSTTTTNSSYNSFQAGAFGVLFRNEYDAYITFNTTYSPSGWLNKYNTYKSGTIQITNGRLSVDLGTGVGAGVASSLTERFAILNNGNVGIGVTNPANKLVATSDATYNGENTYAIAAAAASDSAYKTIIGYDYSNDVGVIAAVRTGVQWKNISIPQGSVGIGTLSPSAKLHVLAGSSSDISLILDHGSSVYRTYFGFDGTGNYIETNGGTTATQRLRLQAYNGSAYTQLFIDGGNQRIYTSANANVGIGLTNPSSKLSVAGNIYAEGATNSITLRSTSGNTTAMELSDGTSYGYLIKNTSSSTANNALAGALYTYTDSNKAFQHIYAGTPLFTILSTGLVGIGTASPATLLQVGSANTSSELLRIGVAYSVANSQRGAITWHDGAGITGKIWTEYDGSTYTKLNFGGLYSGGSYDQGTFLTIRGNGFVGIGNTVPSYKLMVDGNVNASAVVGISNTATSGHQVYMGYNDGTNRVGIDVEGGGGNASSYAIQVGTYFAVRDDGRVGIGTTSPSSTLQVVGNVVATSFTGSLLGNVNGTATTATTATNATNITVTADSTNISRYLTFVGSTSGNNGTLVNADLLFNPSTDLLSINNMWVWKGKSNTANSDNVFIGSGSGANLGAWSAGSADRNTGLGHFTGNALTTGRANMMFGFGAGQLLTTGNFNVFIGQQAGVLSTTNTGNCALGSLSYYAFQNASSNYNTAIGYLALRGTVASSGSNTAAYNVAIGNEAGLTTTTGNYNTIVGSYAGTAMTTGGGNTLIGSGSGASITTGTHNTLVGKYAGTTTLTSTVVLSDGLGNIKFHATGSRTTISGSLAIGGIAASATVGRFDASNDVVAYSTSDIRLKENIQPIENALYKVNQISGNTFDWKSDPELTILHGFKGKDIGIIAQEIESILPEVVTTRDSGYKAVKYEKLVPLLIEAIKELTDKVNKLENK